MAWNEPGNNNRDPWSQGSGKRGDGSPPSLKDLLKKLRAGWGGKGPNGPVLALVAVALLLIWLLSGFYQVDEQEQAVVVRFGAYVGTVGPGAHWHWPAPFEHKKTVNVTVARQISVLREAITKDMNLVDVTLTVQFHIASAEDDLFNVLEPNDAAESAAQAALLEVVSGYSIDEVLGGPRNGSGMQSAIAAEIKSRLQQTIDSYHCGLLVTDATIKADPPETVRKDFYDVIKADEEQKAMRTDAQAYADDRLPRARAEAARQVADANAYHDEVIAHAKGDAARFEAVLAEYRKSPQVTRKRMYLETMGDIYAGTGKVLVDAGHGNAAVNLPLEQILNAAGALPRPSERAAPADATAAPQARGSGPPGSNADSARSRERESH